MSLKKYEVDIDVMKKYDRPGPRYTSYPTAPHFYEEFGPQEFAAEIASGNKADNPSELSLYFHLPFCHSLCYYCACNTIITPDATKIAAYLKNLKREIQLLSEQVDTSREVIQLHWGGGTPTYMSPEQIEDITGFIRSHFNIAANAEISMEIDPRRLHREHLKTLRKVGFNRVSYGVQDFDPKVQQAVNRIQPEELSRSVVSESRDLGFDSVNVDLIYGLPHQTYDSYQRTLDKVIDISPDRLAVFNFAHVPWIKKHQKILKPETLPHVDEKLRILKSVIERLTDAGYVFIGMDHFAKPEDELSVALKNHTLYRNFQGYTTRRGTEVLAMGITSISQLAESYAQNARTLSEYEEMLDAGKLPTKIGCKLDGDDLLRREVITELMCNNRILKGHFEEKYAINFDEYFADAISQLSEFTRDELLENRPDKIQVSETGRLVIRNMAMAFDKYLAADQAQKTPIYSRTL